MRKSSISLIIILIILITILLLSGTGYTKRRLHVKINTMTNGPFKATAEWSINDNPITCEEDSIEYEINKNTEIDLYCTSDKIPEPPFQGMIAFKPKEQLPSDVCNLPVSFTYGGELTCDDCESCEKAINNAKQGQTVKLTLSISYEGEGTCIEWKSSGVTFDCNGNAITGKSSPFQKGIKIFGNKNTLKGCRFWDLAYPIIIKGSDDNIIENNKIETPYGDCITLKKGKGNEIRNNEILDCREDGVFVSESENNKIIQNTIKNCGDDGIDLTDSKKNILEKNIVEENGKNGILLYYSKDNELDGNIVCNNYRKVEDAYDISFEKSIIFGGSNKGDKNKCDKTNNWKDESLPDGKKGCLYKCE